LLLKLKNDKEIKGYVLEGKKEDDLNPFLTFKTGVIGKMFDEEKKLYIPKNLNKDNQKKQKKRKLDDQEEEEIDFSNIPKPEELLAIVIKK
jgi:hypothetical protein